jgi:hypothetical protein
VSAVRALVLRAKREDRSVTKRIPYYQVTDGEWLRVVKRKFREQCCDCGLIHVVDFRVRDNAMEVRATRDDRATAASRRSGKFPKK